MVIATAEARPGDRVVDIPGSEVDDLGPVVLEAARPIYGDHGPQGVRISSGSRSTVVFLDVAEVPTITVARLVTA